MRRAIICIFLIGFCVVDIPTTFSREPQIRLVNGVQIKGTLLEAIDAGLKMQTAKGAHLFLWAHLSPATRFYYEPLFRANFKEILEGVLREGWTNQPITQVSIEALEKE